MEGGGRRLPLRDDRSTRPVWFGQPCLSSLADQAGRAAWARGRCAGCWLQTFREAPPPSFPPSFPPCPLVSPCPPPPPLPAGEMNDAGEVLLTLYERAMGVSEGAASAGERGEGALRAAGGSAGAAQWRARARLRQPTPTSVIACHQAAPPAPPPHPMYAVNEIFGLPVSECVRCHKCGRTTHNSSYTQYFYNIQACRGRGGGGHACRGAMVCALWWPTTRVQGSTCPPPPFEKTLPSPAVPADRPSPPCLHHAGRGPAGGAARARPSPYYGPAVQAAGGTAHEELR